MRLAGLILFLITAWALAERLEDTFYVPLDHPAIQYARAPDDPVARLEKRLESGEVKLEFAPNGVGYLPFLLKQLGISTDSQILRNPGTDTRFSWRFR